MVKSCTYNLNNLDILIFSSSKTATYTLMKTFNNYIYKSLLFHSFNTKNLWDLDINKNNIIMLLKQYNDINKKRLKIVTVIRNPYERIISSYFQLHYDFEIKMCNKHEKDTTIIKNNADIICTNILNSFTTESFITDFYKESLYELMKIFNDDILSKVVLKNGSYYYENMYIELYILDFKKINDINYINTCLDINLTKIISENITSNKSVDVKDKYSLVKEKLLHDPYYIEKVNSLYPQYLDFFINFTLNTV